MVPEIHTVAVIGAGPSGLVAAKYLKAEDSFAEIIVFEQREDVGGIWILTSTDQGSLPTPMYQSLETNIPHELMQFSGHPFPEDAPVFPIQPIVKTYLESYAQDVKHMIKHNSKVTKVRECSLNEEGVWKVDGRSTKDGTAFTQYFDAVVVANGHQDFPRFPEAQGFREWRQRYPQSIIHSKYFRDPEYFREKKVLVVGFSASGIDIAQQISLVCRRPLYVSQRAKSAYHYPIPGLVEYPQVSSFEVESRSVTFTSGVSISGIECVLCCTGFKYEFSFLDESFQCTSKLPSLYQHIFDIANPTLAFVGLLDKTVPWPVSEAQSAVISRIWSRRLNLPSKDSMENWVRGFFYKYSGSQNIIQLRSPYDTAYLNEMLRWAALAEENTGKDSTEDKVPIPWGEIEKSQRQQIPKLKIRFHDLGRDRFSVRNIVKLE